MNVLRSMTLASTYLISVRFQEFLESYNIPSTIASRTLNLVSKDPLFLSDSFIKEELVDAYITAFINAHFVEQIRLRRSVVDRLFNRLNSPFTFETDFLSGEILSVYC